MVIIPCALAVSVGGALSGQDRYTVQVPNGLAFSEFRGYEQWQLIAVSKTEDLLVAILGNTEMIAAYQAGVHGNGSRFPTAPRWRRSIGT
jgi:hypothetical protein